MGSGGFACEQLRALVSAEDIEVLSVVTQLKKEVGRKKELKGTPVFYLANELGVKVYEASTSKMIVDQVDLGEADFVVVADYGVLLKEYVLDAPKIDCINVHGSILPKYRGASPIQSALLDGVEKTGVTIMRMVKAMDAGAIYKIVEYKIEKEDVAPLLYEKLAKLGAEALIDTLRDVYENGTTPMEQDHDKATYCGKINKSDAEVDFMKESAVEIWNKYRAYYFWPKIYFFMDGKRFIVHECEVSNEVVESGSFVMKDGKIVVGTSNGVLGISKIQVEGKQVMSADEMWRGYEALFVGAEAK